ncbi:MAG: ATP-dependent DNA helicase [Pseudomonadota bacterium]
MSDCDINKTTPIQSPSREALSEKGALAVSINGFQTREQQQATTEAIEKAVNSAGSRLIVEAGTGTGKTFAYLVPALLSGKKTLISTGTKNLQDQLYSKDLPKVTQALKLPCLRALLKGRANYLCKHRLRQALEGVAFRSPQTAKEIAKIEAWSHQTSRGDIAEVASIAENAAVWPLVTSNTDNCLGQLCADYDTCFVVQARRKAMEADVIVVNHHLFLADVALKEEGFGELLPNVEVVILDEAHQIPDVATRFFGDSLSSRQIKELCRDVESEYEEVAIDMRQLLDASERLKIAVDEWRLAFPFESIKDAWTSLQPIPQMQAAMEKLLTILAHLHELLKSAQDRSKGLEACFKRTQQIQWMVERIKCYPQENIKAVTESATIDAQSNTKQPQSIAWFETYSQSFVLHLSPLSIAQQFGSLLADPKQSWIFTSATLAVQKDFEHFAEKLGVSSFQALQVESPFDFAKQALVYVPRYLPNVQSPLYYSELMERVFPLINANPGGTFLLFTSHRALKLAQQLIADKIDVPILVQGDKSKQQLLREFEKAKRACLLGTGSFWEGVDIRGQALSLVVIDKLPFASPTDPILKAQIKHLKENGLEPFNTLQIPNAIISLKQGAGRLIRDIEDHGVLVIGDPRLIAKDYGQLFMASLPSMSRTRDNKKAIAFLKNLKPSE